MNDHNPYRPPFASIADVPDAAASARAPRPIAVWLLIALLAILMLISASSLVNMLFLLQPAAHRMKLLQVVLTSLALSAAQAAVETTAVVGLWLGRRWARWLGLALLFLLCAGLLLVTGLVDEDAPPRALAIGLARWIVIPGLGLCWAWPLAFTRKARRYFGLPS